MEILTDFWFMNNVYTIVIPICAYFSYKKGYNTGVDEVLDDLENKGIIKFEEEEEQ